MFGVHEQVVLLDVVVFNISVSEEKRKAEHKYPIAIGKAIDHNLMNAYN
ncbi:MAG: hypothetical protein SFY32_01045 [Bacteroidota bacterium]|nr:hypothetical protein [Bacteroidota bacterium]